MDVPGATAGPADGALPELLDRITAWPEGMPVRLMEEVIRIGRPAVADIAAALARWRADEERDLLWLIVMLGEIGGPDAVAPLMGEIARSDADLLALAAVEGLAKIGEPAVPALREAARAAEPAERLHAYAALGWIDDEVAHGPLVDALRRDAPLVDVIANALADQGRRDAVPALLEAYETCEPWQRPDLEAAIAALEREQRPERLWTRDWRLRYRRQPALEGMFEPEWPAAADILHSDERTRHGRATAPRRSLAEMLAAHSAEPEPPATCEDCGAPVENLSGILVCPQTAVAAAVFQAAVLENAREDGIEDLFDLLDELEAHEFDVRDAPAPVSAKARAEREDALAELAEARATVEWLIASGIEDLAEGAAAIGAALPAVAERHGDPEGLLTPRAPVRSRAEKIGRNDPCPCGSGRKYKRCCLAKAEAGG